MEKQVIEAIKKLAIEFINANWNVPFERYATLFDWIKNGNDELESETTLDQYIKRIKADDTLNEAGWIIKEIALWHNDKFGFLDWEIAIVNGKEFADTELIKFTFKGKNEKNQVVYTTRYFDIYKGGFTEYVKRQKTVDVWEEVS